MRAQYLIDTNVVIELLGEKLPEKSISFLEEVINHNQHHFISN